MVINNKNNAITTNSRRRGDSGDERRGFWSCQQSSGP